MIDSPTTRPVRQDWRPNAVGCSLALSIICLLFLGLCVSPRANAATWTRQPTGTMAWLHGVYFLDQHRGWVAGSAGTLLQTTDGGESWRKLNTLTRDNLRDVYFADEKFGWLLVERDLLKLKSNDEPISYVLKTEDGGVSWRRVMLKTSGDNSRLVRAVFADANRGWVFGETGVVFATQDGGASWARQTSPTKYLLLGGVFTDAAHGWLVGAGATILQTNDGGTNWRTGDVRAGAGTRFTSASFIGNSLGWAVGSAGRIFATTDGGRTWFGQSSNVETDLLDVKFTDASAGWAVGAQGTILQTRDSGIHWSINPSGTSHPLERLFFVDQNHGWAVGFGGTVLTLSPAGAPKLKS